MTLLNIAKKNILYALTVLFITLIISTLAFVLYFQGAFLDFYINQYSSTHEKIAKNVTGIEYQLQQFSNFIIDDMDVLLLITDSVENNIDTRMPAINAIHQSKILYNVNDLIIIDPRSDTIWIDNSMIPEKISDYIEQNESFELFYSKFLNGENFFNTDTHDICCFVTDYRGYIVMYKIPQSQVEQMVFYTNFKNDINTWVYYKNMQPLVNQTKPSPMETEALSKRINTNQNGSFLYDGTFYICSNIRDVMCVSNVPYSSMILQGIKTASFIWFLTMILLLFISAITKVAIKFFKKTISSYNKQIAILDKKINYTQQERVILKLFNDTFNSTEDTITFYKAFDEHLSCHYIAIIVTDDNSVALDNEYILKQSFTENFDKNTVIMCINIAPGKYGVVLALDTIPDIRNSISNIKLSVEAKHACKLSFFVSTLMSDISELHDHIICLNSLQGYHFLTGIGSIIYEDNIFYDEKCEYPITIQRNIITACNNHNIEAVSALLQDFKEYILNNDYRLAENWTIMLYVNIMRNLKFTQEAINFHTINILTSSNYFDDAAEHFIKYLENLSTMPGAIEVNDSFLTEINNIVEKMYSDSNFDLSYVANHLNLSSVYFSRKFKKSTDKNFSQFLTEYRISKSLDMLIDTNEKIKDIAFACGFSSVTYYTTTFKKHMIISPQEYRTKMSKQNI